MDTGKYQFHSENIRRIQHEALPCANCDIAILWTPTFVQGQAYCCTGCAAGGPCSCDYSQYRSVKIVGVIYYTPEQEATYQEYPPISFEGENIMVKIHPVGDRVVVKPTIREEVTKTGLVIPDTAKERPQQGTIIAVGTGRVLENGERVPIEVHEGDKVLFAKFGGTEFKLDGEEFLVMKENDILAIIS